MTSGRTWDAERIDAAVAAMVDSAFAQVLVVRDQLCDCFRVFGEDPLTRRDIASIQPRVAADLRKSQGLLRGAGVAFAPGLLMDARLWIDWWVVDDAGVVTATTFDFCEQSLNFYDYTRAEWYLAPRNGEKRCLVGPYVDLNGVNDYIVTATTPVYVAGRFVGIAGADLRVDEIERRLYAATRDFSAELVVVNSSERIVASTSAHYVAGSLLRASGAHVNHAATTVLDRHRLPGISWSVVVVD